jgi:AcrR family transcriptional regulator
VTATPSSSRIGRRREAAVDDGTANYHERREAIVRAGAQVFKQKGYDRATLGDVARALGTDRATLYYYVPNKAELFRLVVRDVLVGNMEAVEALATSSEPAPARLATAIRLLMQSFHENYPYLYVYVQEDVRRVGGVNSDWSPDMVEFGRRYDAAVVRIVEQGFEDGSLRSALPAKLVAYSIVGMLSWSYRWFREDGSLTGIEIGDALAAMVLDGLTTVSD